MTFTLIFFFPLRVLHTFTVNWPTGWLLMGVKLLESNNTASLLNRYHARVAFKQASVYIELHASVCLWHFYKTASVPKINAIVILQTHTHTHASVCQELSNPDMQSCVGSVGTACAYVVRNPQLSGMGRWLARPTCPHLISPYTHRHTHMHRHLRLWATCDICVSDNQSQGQTHLLLRF